jgi:hypothetical protein
MNPKLASKNPAMQAAWTEATDALMRFKASRDTVDRERALAKLYAVALYEARFLVKRKVDTKLAPDQRRNVDDMAADAAHSILFHERKKDGATGLTVIANKVSADFDPEDGDDLRPLILAILSNKLMDYVRKKPIPGVEGRGAAPGAAAPVKPAASGSPPAGPTLADFAQSLLPDAGGGVGGEGGRPPSALSTLMGHADGDGDGWGAAPGGVAPEPHHEDDHVTPQLLDVLTRHFAPDEAEVFLCKFDGLTNDEGLEYLNELHPQREGPDGKMHPYISRTTYNRKLRQAREKLVKLYPDLRP